MRTADPDWFESWFYGTGQRYQTEMNYELIVFTTILSFKDLGVNVLAGGNAYTFIRKDLDASTVNGLTIYDLYALSNSVASPL